MQNVTFDGINGIPDALCPLPPQHDLLDPPLNWCTANGGDAAFFRIIMELPNRYRSWLC